MKRKPGKYKAPLPAQMDSGEMKPRQLANLMIQEFLDGSQVQIDPKDYPKAIQGAAIAHARNTAAMVILHARKALSDGQYLDQLQIKAGSKNDKEPGVGLARMIIRYLENRHKRKGAAA